MSEIIKDVLRIVSSSLQIPTIIILLLLVLATVVLIGTFIAEYVSERKSLKTDIPKLIDEMQEKSSEQLLETVKKSGLLKRQKAAAEKLITRIKYPDNTREALARQLLADEEARYTKITKITDIIARVAPMFGLMGTLIPLGPGLIALAQGDTKTLSDSLLIAFDTTVAGLISAAVAYFISGVRKGWYEKYMVGLETVFETILEEQNRERTIALARLRAMKDEEK